jgi:hypothetical protein
MGFMWARERLAVLPARYTMSSRFDLAAIADIAAKAIGVRQAALPVAADRIHKLFWRYA